MWTTRDFASFGLLFKLPDRPTVLAVDMPIGLPDHTPKGGRACETLARAALGRKSSSVFSAVGRKALAYPTRAEAHAASLTAGGIGIGAQAWGLAAKLREVDLAISADKQIFVFEVHPEVCFWEMNGGSPMKYSKKSAPGEAERIAVLQRSGAPATFLAQELERLQSGRDDFLDACAAAWTARRIAQGTAARMPIEPTRDSRGLDMAIWY